MAKKRKVRVADLRLDCTECGTRVVSPERCDHCGAQFCLECFYEFDTCPVCIFTRRDP